METNFSILDANLEKRRNFFLLFYSISRKICFDPIPRKKSIMSFNVIFVF